MFTNDHEHMVEDICYKVAHMEQVMSTIKTNFPKLFEQFLRTRESDMPKEYIDALRDRLTRSCLSLKHWQMKRLLSEKHCKIVLPNSWINSGLHLIKQAHMTYCRL